MLLPVSDGSVPEMTFPKYWVFFLLHFTFQPLVMLNNIRQCYEK